MGREMVRWAWCLLFVLIRHGEEGGTRCLLFVFYSVTALRENDNFFLLLVGFINDNERATERFF